MRTWVPEVGQLSAAQGGLASRSTRIRSPDSPSWLLAHGFDLPFCADRREGLDPDLESGPWLGEQKHYDFYRTLELRSEWNGVRGFQGLPKAWLVVLDY